MKKRPVFATQEPDPPGIITWKIGPKCYARIYFYGVEPFEPPVIRFDAQGAARVPRMRWQLSSGDEVRYVFYKGEVTVHASAIATLEPSHLVGKKRLGVNNILGQYQHAYVQFDPFEESWVTLRHQYGLRPPPEAK